MFSSLSVPKVQGRRALLVINCQKDNFAASRVMAPNPPDFLGRIRNVIPYYRSIGTDIVWIKTEVKYGERKDSSSSGKSSPTYDLSTYLAVSNSGPTDDGFSRTLDDFATVVTDNGDEPAFKRHPDGGDLVDELADLHDKDSDLVVTKNFFSAFDQTQLLMCLRLKMVTNIHLCGCLSNVSILNTAADAAQHGFEVSVLEDCLGYRNEKQHIDAMQTMADNIGVSGVDSEEIVDEAGGRPPPDADPSIFLGPGMSGINISAEGGGVAALRSDRGSTRAKASPTRPRQGSRWAIANQPHTGPIGEGDSSLHLNALSSDLAADAFERLKSEVDWQIMKHRTGEVPRRVAVQGEVDPLGAVPVYRHPADESPPLIPFTRTVRQIRDQCQTLLGQPFNHVLVQLYRSGEDNISEHSDKTLDIVRGSDIVNVSFGAERRMNLRLKKAAVERGSSGRSPSEKGNPVLPRESQRIPLPHNSVFVLGWKSNARWLHGIRPDKRLEAQRSDAEKAYSGERISLTFRNIGTFTDANRTCIWGQGAKNKTKEKAAKILTSDAGESEKMVTAFGRENQNPDFDWDASYGCGFDVLDLTVVNRPAVLNAI